jgi:hypothetical protein
MKYLNSDFEEKGGACIIKNYGQDFEKLCMYT